MARSQAIDTRLEKLIPAMQEWITYGVFTKHEAHEITRTRSNHEYRLAARPLLLLDVNAAIEFELGLEAKLEKYANEHKVKMKHRWDVQERIDKIYKIALSRLRETDDKEKATNNYVNFLRRFGKKAGLSQHFAYMIQKFPSKAQHWVNGSNWELECGKVDSARTLLQEGLRNVPDSEDLWVQSLSLELQFVARLVHGIFSTHRAEALTKVRKAKHGERNGADEDDDDDEALAKSVNLQLDGGEIADSIRSENAALYSVIVELQMAKLVAGSAVASQAVSAKLIQRLFEECVKFPFAGPLAEIVLHDGLKGLVAKSQQIAKTSMIAAGGQREAGRVITKQLMGKELGPVVALIAAQPIYFARHAMSSMTECLSGVTPVDHLFHSVVEESTAAAKKSAKRKVKYAERQAKKTVKLPPPQWAELLREVANFLLATIATISASSSSSTAGTADAVESQTLAKLVLQHQWPVLLTQFRLFTKGCEDFSADDIARLVWKILVAESEETSIATKKGKGGKKEMRNSTGQGAAAKSSTTPLSEDRNAAVELVATQTMTAPPPVLFTPIGDGKSEKPTEASLRALCIPHLTPSYLAQLASQQSDAIVHAAEGKGTAAVPAPYQTVSGASASVAAFTTMLERLATSDAASLKTTMEQESNVVTKTIQAAIAERDPSVWRLFAVCYHNGVKTGLEAKSGSRGQKLGKLGGGVLSKRGRVLDDDSDDDSDSSDDEDARSSGALIRNATLEAGFTVLGRLAHGALPSDAARWQRSQGMAHLAALLSFDLMRQSGEKVIPFNRSSTSSLATALKERYQMEALTTGSDCTHTVRAVESLFATHRTALAASQAADLRKAMKDVVALTTRFSPVSSVTVKHIVAPFYEAVGDAQAARSAFESLCGPSCPVVFPRNLNDKDAEWGPNAAVNWSEKEQLVLVDRWLEFVKFERRQKDFVRARDLIRRAGKALGGKAAQRFQQLVVKLDA